MAGENEAIMKRADEALAKRNYDYARDLYQTVLIKDPNCEKAHEGLFSACFTKVKELGGKGRLSQMAGNKMLQAQLMTMKNNPDKRIDTTIRFLMDDPNNSFARGVLAAAYLEKGHAIAAAIEAQIAYRIDPKNVEAAKTMVGGLTRQGKVTEAQEILAKVAAIAGDDRDIEKLQRDLAAQQSTGAFSNTGDYREGLKNKEKSKQLEKNTQLIKTEEDFKEFMAFQEGELATTPDDYRIPQKIGQVIFDYKKDYKTAREWFSKASALAPQDSMLRDKLEDCDLRLLDQQVDAAEKSGSANLVELKINRVKAIIASFQRRVADRPTDMGLRYQLGKAYYMGGQQDKAMAEFQQSSKDPKQKVMSHYYLGITFSKKKMFDLADGQFAKSEEAGGGVLAQNLLLDIWYNRAKVCWEAGKKEKAKEYGSKIMEVDIGYKDISTLMEQWTA